MSVSEREIQRERDGMCVRECESVSVSETEKVCL